MIINYFGANLKYLRSEAHLSQEALAKALGITRAKLNSYENAIVVNPPIEFIVNVSNYFKVQIDVLIKNQLLAQPNHRALLEDEYLSGTKLRVLVSTIDTSNRDNIELVHQKVKAGYLAGYNDPEFITSLPTFQLPFLAKERKYRAFQIEGDSMLPIQHGSYVIGEYVQNWHEIKSGEAYVLLTKEEGAVFKIVQNQLDTKRSLTLHSLNTIYKPYEVSIQEVLEVWKFINYFSDEMPEAQTSTQDILNRLTHLESKMNGGGKLL
jgi:transcriptional regulator with XRE-family HTH domain